MDRYLLVASVRLRRVLRAAAAVLSISGCVTAAACSRHADAAARQEPDPAAAPPHEDGVIHIQASSRPFIKVENVSPTTKDSGTTAPARVDFRDGAVSQVGAPLDGRVTKVHVAVGQHVESGDPLVTLDSPDAATMRSAVDVAQAAVREAHLELDRQRRMQQEGVGVERDLVAAETRASSAEADLARVQSTAQTIGKGGAAELIVRAPISGVVITRKASVGMAVQHGGEPLVEIGNAASLWVVADVFERDLTRVRQGAPVEVTLPTVDHPLSGRVTGVGTVVTTGLRTAPVYVTLAEHQASLRPGMSGSVDIAASDAALTLPVSAVLIKDGKDPIVYVERDPLTFVRRRVVLAQPINGQVQIVSGLAAGERVVTHGALLLDGSADQLL